MSPRPFLAALAVLLLVATLPAFPAPNTPGTAVSISGPDRLGASTEGSYNVKIQGPAQVLWGFWVNASGPGQADALLTSDEGTPDSEKPYTMTQNAPLEQPEFNFTLTAPAVAGDLTLTVTAFAMEGEAAAGQTATGRWVVEVKSKREVELNSTVRNSGEVTLVDLKVAFMVRLHGIWTYIVNETVSELGPGDRTNVTTIWDTTVLDSGEYTIRVVVDPDNEKVMYSDSGKVSEKRVVLREVGAKEPEPANWRLVGFIVVVAVAAAIGIYWWRRKKIV